MFYLWRAAGSQRDEATLPTTAQWPGTLKKPAEGNCLVLYDSGSDVSPSELLQAACF